MLKRPILAALSCILLASCLTYYEKNILFHEQFASRNYVEASKSLDKNKYIQKEKNRILYLLDKGVTLQMMGQFEESNKFFEESYIYFEDFKARAGGEALSLVTNEMARDYRGEDFEKVFIHYYKTINYIFLKDLDAALVECRRINIRLNEINDKYKKDTKYKRDAFANVLTGLLYEATGNDNDAFISYRNAYNIYKEDYQDFFGVKAPKQLKVDLIRMARRMGFYDEQDRFERLFGMKYQDGWDKDKELVYIYHNGLGPVKDEWSINFLIVPGAGGTVAFVNEELGLNFTFIVPQSQQADLGNLKFVRVAFPKYVTRKQIVNRAELKIGNKSEQFALLEDINEIAIKSLKDRMVRELSKTILRTALKQAAAAAARQENENLGAAISVLGAVTEKADTRNWQTLPAQIYYTRVPVKKDTTVANLMLKIGPSMLAAPKERIITNRKLNFHFNYYITPESVKF